MTSILDAYKEVFSDKLSFVKIIVFAIPLYYCYQTYTANKLITSDVFWILCATIFFLYGFLIETTYNVINEKDSVLPSLNPFKIAYTSMKGIIAVGPSLIISSLIANYFCTIIHTGSWVDNCLKTIIWLIAISIFVMTYLLFAQNKKILDIFNLKAASEKYGDLIVMILVFALQLILINLPTTALIAYTIFILFGYGPLHNFFLAYAIIFNIAATGHYLAQAHYELLTYNKKK